MGLFNEAAQFILFQQVEFNAICHVIQQNASVAEVNHTTLIYNSLVPLIIMIV